VHWNVPAERVPGTARSCAALVEADDLGAAAGQFGGVQAGGGAAESHRPSSQAGRAIRTEFALDGLDLGLERAGDAAMSALSVTLTRGARAATASTARLTTAITSSHSPSMVVNIASVWLGSPLSLTTLTASRRTQPRRRRPERRHRERDKHPALLLVAYDATCAVTRR